MDGATPAKVPTLSLRRSDHASAKARSSCHPN